MDFLTVLKPNRDNDLMSIDQFLNFWFDHIYSIIQWQFFVIILFAVVVLYFMIRENNEESGAEVSAGQVNQLEETLKRVLKQTEHISMKAGEASTGQGAEGAPVSAEDSNINSEELKKLNLQLKEKQELIEKLTKDIEKSKNSPSEGNDSETKALKDKMAQLEAQLAEYSIIEDDIADLSLYKEENSKLKEELASLKSGGTPNSSAVEESADETAGDSSEDSDLVAEFAEAVGEPTPAAQPNQDNDTDQFVDKQNEEEAVEAKEEIADTTEDEKNELLESVAEQNEAKSGDDAEDFITDDILAEFSAAVDKEFGNALSEISSSDVSAEISAEAEDPQAAVDAAMAGAASVPTPPQEEMIESQDDVDKLFAQAQAQESQKESLSEEASSKESDVASADAIDTEKMLGEMASLQEAAENADGNTSLEEELDIDKMAQEASTLTNEDSKA
ncbi:MAG: hypothetical protein KDD50_04130 [Bdellovibrionales bacterium]|nr:hypothetical protein [Bdellovibrionales bacterium]